MTISIEYPRTRKENHDEMISTDWFKDLPRHVKEVVLSKPYYLDYKLAGTADGGVIYNIDYYAENEGIDLIVMGTHGYKGFEKILFGSVAGKVVKSAPCPVLIINPYKT